MEKSSDFVGIKPLFGKALRYFAVELKALVGYEIKRTIKKLVFGLGCVAQYF